MVESSVTFDLADPIRFAMLERAFNALRDAKGNHGINMDDQSLRSFFDEASLSHFWKPTPEELADWSDRWFNTPVEKRFTDPMLKTPWQFESTIDAFRNGDYNLLRIIRTSDVGAALQFQALAHPYRGTGCMHALINCFGGIVTGEFET